MNAGKRFEDNFSKSIPDNIYFLRLKDSATGFSRSASRFTSKNPFDYLLFINGNLFPMELKSTKDKSLSIQFDEDKGKDIKWHQIESLRRANEFNGVIAGFVFEFRGYDTYWISIEDFDRFLAENNKKSINIEDVKRYNSIKIDRKLLRTNYRYNISKLIEDIVQKERK